MISNSKNTDVNSAVASLIQGQDGWLTNKDFYGILKRERARSDRTGSPISYVQIELSDNPEDESKRSYHPNPEHLQALDILINFISENSRISDLKFLRNPYEIGILLLDTPMNDAKYFIEKITPNLYQYMNSFQNNGYIDVIHSIKISSYPLNQGLEFDRIEARPIYIRGSSIRDSVLERRENNMLSDSTNIHLEWNLSSTLEGSIALKKPVFWNVFLTDHRKFFYYIIKRVVDILGAIVGLILISPIWLFIAAVIKLTSQGPVLFKQKRMGYHGRPFYMCKFRTMYASTHSKLHKEYVKGLIDEQLDEEDIKVYKQKITKGITPFGQFLRRNSLDELPQLINILKGEMSIVGPRPHPYYEVEHYKSWYSNRLKVKPGLTGISKLLIRDSSKNYVGSMRLDIWYVNNCSMFLDIKILFQTIYHICLKRH